MASVVVMVSVAVTLLATIATFILSIVLSPYSVEKIYKTKPFTVYGHVHIAKTAGTTLNGELAAKFERVCGHKGYSYDAYQANLRENRTRHDPKSVKPDLINVYDKGHSRLRVPDAVMEEIGFENCQYISHETVWQFWPDTFQDWDVPIELHIPCRDPISHLMSMCNYKEIEFNCSNREIISEVERCIMNMERFSMKLIHSYSNIQAKCFLSQSIAEYMEYMENHLQRKRKEAQYVFRATNRPRAPENECIWKDETLLENVKRYLLGKYEYYQYCSSCIGSKDDLLSNFKG